MNLYLTGKTVLLGNENPDRRDIYLHTYLADEHQQQPLREVQTIHSGKEAKFHINFLATLLVYGPSPVTLGLMYYVILLSRDVDCAA